MTRRRHMAVGNRNIPRKVCERRVRLGHARLHAHRDGWWELGKASAIGIRRLSGTFDAILRAAKNTQTAGGELS